MNIKHTGAPQIEQFAAHGTLLKGKHSFVWCARLKMVAGSAVGVGLPVLQHTAYCVKAGLGAWTALM